MYCYCYQGPQLVIIVPTRDLGVQVALLAYKLLGGSVSHGYGPGSQTNMFRYHGPRGILVKGLLRPEEVDATKHGRHLHGVHVVVGTPELVAAAMKAGSVCVAEEFRTECEQWLNSVMLSVEPEGFTTSSVQSYTGS